MYLFPKSTVRQLLIVTAIATLAPTCVKFIPSATHAGYTFTRNCNGRGSCTVAFTNTSTGAVSYHWSLGDDSTSVDVNPVHVYNTNSTRYIVTLEAIGRDDESHFSDTVNLCTWGSCQ